MRGDAKLKSIDFPPFLLDLPFLSFFFFFFFFRAAVINRMLIDCKTF